MIIRILIIFILSLFSFVCLANPQLPMLLTKEGIGSINIQYVFGGKWNGPNGKIPPNAILNNWTLKQITWLASKKYPLEMHQYCRAFNLDTD